MKRLAWGMGGLIGAAVFVWLCGWLLPPRHEASASIRLRAAPEAVWAVLTAVENYPRWRSDVSAVESMAPEPAWKEYDARGRVTWHASGGEADSKWVDRVVKSDSRPLGSRRFLIVEDTGGGTRVVITEMSELKDPLARFRARFVKGYATDLRTLLEELRKRLGG